MRRESNLAPEVSETPPEIDEERAIRLNRQDAESLGWGRSRPDISRLLGFTTSTPDEPSFARAVFDWQRRQGLAADGVVGPNTWARLQCSLNEVHGTHLAVDGLMGPKTRSAVRSFQSTNGLRVDGIVGPRTEAALVAAGARLPPQAGGS
jgi:peptidoglycan hydrolase-like protein with peptidoglycan-binding domain